MNKKIFLLIIIGIFILTVIAGWFLVKGNKKGQNQTAHQLNLILDTLNWKAPLQPASRWQNTAYLAINKIRYYAQEDFFELDLQTLKASSLTGGTSIFPFIIQVSWSPGGEQVIAKITNDNYVLDKVGSPFYDPSVKDGAQTVWFYDFNTKKSAQLNLNIKEFGWESGGKKIIYHYHDANTNSLNISDPDGKNWKKIIDLKDENAFLNTLSTGEIIYSNSEKSDSFNVIKTDGSGKRTIKLPLAINADKMVWSPDGKSVLAAIREQSKATDTLYRISTETGQKEEIKYQSQAPIDAKNLMLTKDNKILYFTSEDFLYKLGI